MTWDENDSCVFAYSRYVRFSGIRSILQHKISIPRLRDHNIRVWRTLPFVCGAKKKINQGNCLEYNQPFFFVILRVKMKDKGLGTTTFLQSAGEETGNNHQTWRTRTGMMDFSCSSLSLTMSSIFEARISFLDVTWSH